MMNTEQLQEEIKKLNPAQREAVLHTAGPLLVVAGAGSGKTKVATVRIAHLIHSGVSPDNIVGVTFTNKAAKEMKHRVANLVGCSILVSTFHSLGLKILRESGHHLGYPSDVVVYDSDDNQKALKMVLKELSLGDDLVSSMQSSISTLKNKLMAPTGQELIVYQKYTELLKRSGAVDFDDLLLLPVTLFRQHPEVLRQYQERWKYLLVDEYQDTNYAQSVLISLLAGGSRNVFAVGDPDQSIYSWRGADISNILGFQEEYESSKVVRLEENYRSHQRILQASNALIAHNSGRIEKNLYSQKGDGEPVVLFCAKTERQEAEFIAEAIETYLAKGVLADEIAILFRTNGQSRSLEDGLLSRKIPYRIHGGVSFYQRKEVKDILSYLRVALQPNDTLAFTRSIQAQKRGLGASSVEKIQAIVQETGYSFVQVIADIVSGDSSASFGTKQKEALRSYLATIRQIMDAIESGVHACIDAVVFDGGYLKSLEADDESCQERSEIVSELVAKAHEWDREERGPLQQFLEEVALNQANEESSDESCVLMTIHNAKGLEFKVVFVAGLEEDILPHINSKKSPESVEEERRLLYVAMTRAREKLLLTCSQTRLLWGGFRNMRPSQFLYEIPKQMLKMVKGVRDAVGGVEYSELPKAASRGAFEAGQIVMHTHFGVGRVERVITAADGLFYEVYFGKDGTRKKISGEMNVLHAI